MKVLFIISCVKGRNSGFGGHYYSLMTIASAMTKHSEATIVLISDMECPSLKTYSGQLIHLPHKSLQSDTRSLAKLALSEKADVLHSFDIHSHRIAKSASAQSGIPLVITKPGGSPCGRAYPYADDITVFSSQDYDLLNNHPSFRKAKIHLIPNRVASRPVNTERLQLLTPYWKKGYFKFILISTLNRHKVQIFRRCINLVNRLNNVGIKTQAIIISSLYDQCIHSEIRAQLGEYCSLLTTKEYTVEAAEFLPAADAAISMGRSTMESTAVGIPVLCCANNLEIPYLLTEENVANAIRYNFTARAEVSITEANAFNKIADMITRTAAYKSASQVSQNMFSTYCDVDQAIPRYLDIYRVAKPAKTLCWEKQRQAIAQLIWRKSLPRTAS